MNSIDDDDDKFNGNERVIMELKRKIKLSIYIDTNFKD
jgi:hypothetical protein